MCACVGWGICTCWPQCLAWSWCPAFFSSWGFAKVGAGQTWRHMSKATATASLRLCQWEGKHLGVSTSSPCHHPLTGWLRITSAVVRISFAAGQHCSSACEQESQRSHREIPPRSAFVGPCTECWPDPGLLLPKVWVEVGRRGLRGAIITEKSEKRCVAHSTPVSLLPTLMFLITAC